MEASFFSPIGEDLLLRYYVPYSDTSVLKTPSLCSSGRSKYWSLCVLVHSKRWGFRPPLWTQPRNGGLFYLVSSLVNLILLSAELICSARAFTSRVLILAQVSSMYLNHWLVEDEGEMFSNVVGDQINADDDESEWLFPLCIFRSPYMQGVASQV